MIELLKLLSFQFFTAFHVFWFVKGVLSFFLATFHINYQMICVREDLSAFFSPQVCLFSWLAAFASSLLSYF
ncbi:hypothetical protein NC653_004304 [Populus alba x Populus x berolinensis]|uniref:Uncharacterized protein n=1 Tax=Populus alba x Populus x berolinensis TaxID=444605 RepID=A0AAD6RVX7_9ROSI|nr:hypothetical protein NC653_004304 [Populus alba x Populus x berolinensis]